MKVFPQHQPPSAIKTALSGPYGAFINNNALKAIIFVWLILAAMLTLLSLIAPVFITQEITQSRDNDFAIAYSLRSCACHFIAGGSTGLAKTPGYSTRQK